MSHLKTWRLCAVRTNGADAIGRAEVAEIVEVNTSNLGAIAKACGGEGAIEGASLLAFGVEDAPAIREALGLKPSPAFTRKGGEVSHTGVAGTMEEA